ncbi:MAG: FAD-dependent oxidoreductase [Butyrivibrio sp.]|nr:FAD-dependent oxidoreductase [Butyrivibrio sp.]
MIRITQIKMPLSHTQEDILRKAAGILHIKKAHILSFHIIKKSIDARKKPKISVIYTLDVEIENEEKILRRIKSKQVQKAEDITYTFPQPGQTPLNTRPVIIGTGPAGLFCGYYLALHGYRPILLERGKRVEERTKDVDDFWRSGVLNTESNIQFGEGGAGTFSDGKLNTLVRDKNGRNREVLRLFAETGAPEEIMYESKPHIGTDILVNVVKNLREKIVSMGADVRFESKVTDIEIENGRVKAVIINDNERLETDIAVLAIGHSARDTFKMLHGHNIPMSPKAFAVGYRVEHPRKMIDLAQYGMTDNKLLQAADYKLTAKTAGGRGVYSFCMCPGGYVVNASSEEGRLAINGMSYSGRNADNSNSAIIVSVTPDDFGGKDALAGVEFQRRLEEKAYKLAGGKVPVETYGDFKQAVTGEEKQPSAILKEYPGFTPSAKGGCGFAPVHEILPKTLNDAFMEGMEQFGSIISGFNDSAVYVSGIESRTSSPVRIHRDESGQSDIKGLYPCGEGTGYAGGITSAAMDGILIAEKIAGEYFVRFRDELRRNEQKRSSNA